MKKKELIYSEDIVSDLKKVVAKNMEEKITLCFRRADYRIRIFQKNQFINQQ